MTTCTLKKAIVGFTKEAQAIPREAPPIEVAPCTCEEGQCVRPSVRQILTFLRVHPAYVDAIEQFFPDVSDEEQPREEQQLIPTVPAVAITPSHRAQWTGYDLQPIVEALLGRPLEASDSAASLTAKAEELRRASEERDAYREDAHRYTDAAGQLGSRAEAAEKKLAAWNETFKAWGKDPDPKSIHNRGIHLSEGWRKAESERDEARQKVTAMEKELQKARTSSDTWKLIAVEGEVENRATRAQLSAANEAREKAEEALATATESALQVNGTDWLRIVKERDAIRRQLEEAEGKLTAERTMHDKTIRDLLQTSGALEQAKEILRVFRDRNTLPPENHPIWLTLGNLCSKSLRELTKGEGK